jgi:hypothetical protein
MAAYVGKQNARRRKSLRRIEQLASEISADRTVNCFDYVFTRKDDRWTEIRILARDLLDDYGWPRKRPPKRGSMLFVAPQS